MVRKMDKKVQCFGFIQPYSLRTFVETECHLHGQKNRQTFQYLQNIYHSIVLVIFDDVIFEYIVINYFSKTYFCTILLIIKICLD